MDRRQRRTRRAIYEAFEQLLANEHYRSITVAQIIERADVGRSTFYAHFATKDDLLDEMCQEMFAHVFEGVEGEPHAHEAPQEPTLEGALTHLLSHLRDDHQGVCGKLLTEGEPHVTAYFRGLLGTFMAPRLPDRSSWVPRDLMQQLVVSCFCEAVAWWHASGYEASPRQLAHWYVRTLGWPVESHAHHDIMADA